MTRKAIVCLLSVAVLGVVVWWVRLSDRGVTHLTADDVQSIEVVVSSPFKTEDFKRVTFRTESRAAIEAFVSSLQASEETKNHRCAPVGTVRIMRGPGLVDELRILPGHNPLYYEYRYNGSIYRVPRPDFVAALKLVGVEDVPMGQ